ncbi:MAG: hypothetical protein KGI37_01870 [Alphaproteobacteria bacterium]|nr:hypothetical protein [Alphaproteobacteria bacterium]
MRLVLILSLLTLISAVCAEAQAQSILDNLPGQGAEQPLPPAAQPPAPTAAPIAVGTAAPAAPATAGTADPYTVTDIAADVTADTAAHARDQALIQAEHAGFAQLCARFNTPPAAAQISDDDVAALVQSFDLQSEKLAAGRFIGVFTLHFDPVATQKRLGKYVAASGNAPTGTDSGAGSAAIAAHVQIAVSTPSLAAWAQTRRQLAALPQTVRIDTLDLGRGTSHIDLVYSGSFDDLKNAMTSHGLKMNQSSDGTWQLTDSGAP